VTGIIFSFLGKNHDMKKAILILLLTGFIFSAFAQDRAIGLRFGAPMGISYKKYMRNHKAIELGIGTVTQGWYNQYYENSFSRFAKYNNGKYLSHQTNSNVFFQGRYLLDYDIQIEGMMGKLNWYWGVGGVLKFGSVEYRYRDQFEVVRTDVHSDIDLGPEGVIGMEYTFEQVPITIFGDFSLMVELADRPGTFKGFSGVGGRYHF
jgi:hypothetical protein